MNYQVELVEVESRALAAAKRATTFADLGRTIRSLLDEVYAFLRADSDSAPVKQTGHNIVLYFDGGATIQAGVEVGSTFKSAGSVESASTPFGRAAHTLHIGPYSGLSAAHKATREWCSGKGYELKEPCWEIYGDWDTDETRLRTDVYYLVAGS